MSATQFWKAHQYLSVLLDLLASLRKKQLRKYSMLSVVVA